MELQLLDEQFKKGNFTYKQISINKTSYIYEVKNSKNKIWYHVFERKLTSVCIDFEKRIYSDSEFKESYPKDEDFGKWAWCCTSLEKAIEYFKK